MKVNECIRQLTTERGLLLVGTGYVSKCPSPPGSSLSLWEVEPARAVPMQSELRGSSWLHLDYAKEARRGNKYSRWTQEFPGAKA